MQTEQRKTSSLEFLSKEVLKTKTKEELRLIRNEVFARKGYTFKSKDLNNYFKSKSWYKPDADANINSLKLTKEESDYINN